MPFDPNLPGDGQLIRADELRAQFNGLKSQLDAFSGVPVGCILGWCKNLTGVPALPPEWAECNGQTISDPTSPLDGVTLENLNNSGRFLRGAVASGGIGGLDYFATSAADNAGLGPTFAAVTTSYSPGAEPFPPFYTVVWIIKIR